MERQIEKYFQDNPGKEDLFAVTESIGGLAGFVGGFFLAGVSPIEGVIMSTSGFGVATCGFRRMQKILASDGYKYKVL